jgi:hypothetical protein
MSLIRLPSLRGIDSLHHRRHLSLSASHHPRLLPAGLEAYVPDQACEPKPDALHCRAVIFTTSTSSLAFYALLTLGYAFDTPLSFSMEPGDGEMAFTFDGVGGRIFPFSVALTFPRQGLCFLFVPLALRIGA